MDQEHLAQHWKAAARRTARKVNLGWWVEKLTPWLGAAGLTGFATVFALRWNQVPVSLQQVWPYALGGVALCGVGAWWRAKKNFITDSEGLVRLESQLQLHNSLTAAQAGIASWPEPAMVGDDGLHWKWQWVGGPLAGAMACVALGLFIPISSVRALAEKPAEPLAWGQMEDWLNKLEEEKVLTPEQLEELREKVEEFRDKPEKEWYEQHSLEASDSMRDQLEKNLQDMGRNLEQAERSLNALEKYDSQLSTEAKDQLAQDFNSALQGLNANDLKLDPELMKQLGKIDPKSLKGLSQEQLSKLREEMKKKGGA